MDNAGSTNKNRYMFAWTIDAVQSCFLDSILVAFMVAGHTKFDPDRMFSAILSQLYTNTTVSDGSIVYPWRDYLKKKYTDLPGTRKYHVFLTTSNHHGKVTVKAREKCYRGEFQNTGMRRLKANNYSKLGQAYNCARKPIPMEKLQHVRLMCRQYISPGRWPKYAK